MKCVGIQHLEAVRRIKVDTQYFSFNNIHIDGQIDKQIVLQIDRQTYNLQIDRWTDSLYMDKQTDSLQMDRQTDSFID